MKAPDFVIAGATHSGLNALVHVLRTHPQVYIPRANESRFFIPGQPVKRLPPDLRDDFEIAASIRHNNEIPLDRILHGEEEFDHLRAHKGNPHAKVIFTLRNPIMRAHMQFHHAKALGREMARNLEQAVEEELSGKRTPENSNLCWLYKNQYQTHVSDWLKLYTKEKLLVVVCEEWSVEGHHHGFSSLEQFLGLKKGSLQLQDALRGKSEDSKPFYEKLLPRSYDYPPLNEKIQKQLEDLFTVDIDFIQNLLGRKILPWS